MDPWIGHSSNRHSSHFDRLAPLFLDTLDSNPHRVPFLVPRMPPHSHRIRHRHCPLRKCQEPHEQCLWKYHAWPSLLDDPCREYSLKLEVFMLTYFHSHRFLSSLSSLGASSALAVVAQKERVRPIPWIPGGLGITSSGETVSDHLGFAAVFTAPTFKQQWFYCCTPLIRKHTLPVLTDPDLALISACSYLKLGI